MKQNIIHIGLDVDDTQYHGSAFNKATGEVVDFKSRPTLKRPVMKSILTTIVVVLALMSPTIFAGAAAGLPVDIYFEEDWGVASGTMSVVRASKNDDDLGPPITGGPFLSCLRCAAVGVTGQ